MIASAIAWIAACISAAFVGAVAPAVVRLVAQTDHEARVGRIVEIDLRDRGQVRLGDRRSAAKYGDCVVADVERWQSEQYVVTSV